MSTSADAIAGMPDIRRAGDRALLLDVGGLAAAQAWHRALTHEPLPGQIEAVAAARTVLLRFRTAPAAEAARTSLAARTPSAVADHRPRTHVLDVAYDGEDLEDTADLMRISAEALVRAHSDTTWVAAFGGFAPGFLYCVPASDGAGAWDVPRLAEPRTGVPPGAVALAGGFSAVYPRRSPGGWRLIGRTGAPLWVTDREQPALLRPGDRIRYQPVRAFAATAVTEQDESTTASATETSTESPTTRTVLRVDDPGAFTLIEDAGRPGWGDVGVSPSGFADRSTACAANTVVGNDPDAPLLEVMGDARLTCLADVVVAVAGAAGDGQVRADLLRAGEQLALTATAELARTYVAVRGGLVATAEVGSTSTDVLSGLGPAPVLAGTDLAVPLRGPVGSVGPAVQDPSHARLRAESGPADGAGADAEAEAEYGAAEAVVIRVLPGPRDDWFAPSEYARFLSLTWTVAADSNRVGTRLSASDGAAPLRRERDAELPSEGTVTGTVQVPASGQPVVFGPDRPVTGGYPAIATVVAADLDRLAQLRPGDQVRFAAQLRD